MKINDGEFQIINANYFKKPQWLNHVININTNKIDKIIEQNK